MSIRRLFAAALVLAALAATLYWANRRHPAEDAARSSISASIKILDPDKDNISRIEIRKKNGSDVVLSRTDLQNWKITAPTPMLAEPDQVFYIVSALTPVNSEAVIEEKANDLKPYGLTEPDIKVSVTGKDGKTQNLLIGEFTPTANAAYAMVEGDPRLFTIGSSTKTSLDKGVKDLQNKHLLSVDFEKASKVEITGPKLNLAFSSDNGQWTIQSPKDVRGNIFKLGSVVEQLKSATVDLGIADQEMKKAASMFSSGSPVVTVKVAAPSGSQELQVRKNNGAYYAKSTIMQSAYPVSKDLGAAIDNKNIDDFREKKLFDINAENPKKIEMRSGEKSYSLTRNGDNWWSDGKKMDPLSVESLITAIEALSATKFVATGFSTPAVTLTVTSMDGKRVEKVLISKDGSRYVAKRENDPLLYEVDAKQIEDLTKLAGDIKPAALEKSLT
jgi:hypothetical protein